MDKTYSAVIWLERVTDGKHIGLTHCNDAFRTPEAAQRWIDRQMSSLEHYKQNGVYTMHSEVN